ncbi:hypothetical protein QQZ08_006210 [Neonectria magnoliae]|uniref:DUF6604 domain-containing protein n=1 Tax=Neonectria magnoliae TaxID=2732573 RepID=A0ABR1I1Z4_9HYPO
MLPKSLVSVYQEYKRDTNSVASWLASTAKACGYPLDLLSNEPPAPDKPKASGRLKGKARTEAKKKGKAPAEPAPETAHMHIIAIKDFVPLAECIAGSKHLVTIPDAFGRALTRVIAVRASFGAKLSKHGAEPDAESDTRHSHFVGVLEKVHGLLQPLMSTTVAASTDPVETLNKFSGLTVYEPSEVFLDAPDIERPKKTGQENIVYEIESPRSLEDALVAFQMMLDDLKNIRDFISNIWSGFSDETNDQFLDPAAVAIATNTGIDLARNLIDGMLPVFEDHGGVYEMCRQYFTSVLLREGYSAEDIATWTHEHPKYDFYDLGSACYFNTGLLINTLSGIFRSQVPVYEDDEFGVYDPTSDRGSKTGHEKFKEDHILITELFLEALTIIHHVPGYPIVDEFIRGVKEFHETGKVPFFLIFAAQITLDIHHVLRDHAETAVTILFKRLTAMKTLLRSHILFHENLKRPHWSYHNDKSHQCNLKMLRWFMEDPLHEAKALITAGGKPTMMQSIKKHRLLRRSPIVTGLALYHFRAALYDTSLTDTNAWATLILPAHLYNAARVRGFTSCFWYDTELLIQKYGEEQFFVGGRPTNITDCFTRFLLHVGLSASVFSNRRRQPLRLTPSVNNFSRAGPRYIKHGATVSRIFQDRYGRNYSGAINWTPESIKEILGHSQVGERDVDGVTLMGRTGSSAKPQRKRAGLRAKPKHKRTEVADDRRFSAGELLSSLVMAMQAEVAEFAFPYLLMHQYNWGLMRTIQTKIDAIIRDEFGPPPNQAEWQLPYILCNILCLDRPEDSSIWQKVGMAFNAMNAIEGSSAAIKALDELSGLRLEIPEYFGIENFVSEGLDEEDEEGHEHHEDDKNDEEEEKN